jgi:hypothetical protein
MASIDHRMMTCFSREVAGGGKPASIHYNGGAVQQYFGVAPSSCVLDGHPSAWDTKRKILAGGIDMSVAWTANLDPKIIALVDTAFDKSWQFVRTDPELAHRDVREMRASLTESLTRLAQNGERDVWRLANGAIGQLRRQRSAA